MSSLAIYGPHSTPAQQVTRYRSKSPLWPMTSDVGAKMALALTATLAPYSLGGVHQTISSTTPERISVASTIEMVSAPRKSGRRSYTRSLTLEEHQVFQAAILENVEVVHRGRYAEL